MSFKIQLINQDTEFQVDAEHSILESALNQGHNLPYGCRNGACGACKCKIVSGTISYPEHLPEGLTEEEHAQATP